MKNLKFFVIIFFLIFSINNYSFSIENKIVVKVNNFIITSIDIRNEISYLRVLNPKLDELKKDKIFEIAKNSLIKEKIKEIEILKFVEEFNINDEIFNQFVNANFLRLGFENKEQFISKMNASNVNLKDLKKKINIEALWSQIIFNKFSTKLRINKEEIKDQVLKINNKKKSYLLYEILFKKENSDNENKKRDIILESIKNEGFENAALMHSLSETSKYGGRVGWIDEGSLNNSIKHKIIQLDIGKITEPIIIPGGYLILKVKDIKEETKKINFEEEFNRLIKAKTNEQLNQFSNNYFEKIKKDIFINEI